MNVHEVKSIETKSILSRLKSKDNYWGIAYNMNLYRVRPTWLHLL